MKLFPLPKRQPIYTLRPTCYKFDNRGRQAQFFIKCKLIKTLKYKYSIAAILSALFIGCSSTYRISDFLSKDKFYEDFNKFAENKSVKVTLMNDSTFNINSAKIQDDSIYSIENENIVITKEIDTSEIKELSYNKFQIYAYILFKDGNSYEAHNVEFHNDSIYFSYDTNIIMSNNISSLNKIKDISYKNHWLGLPIGTILGSVIGLGSAILYGNVNPLPANSQSEEGFYIFFGAPVIGFIAGGIWGWIEGWDYVYEFSTVGGSALPTGQAGSGGNP